MSGRCCSAATSVFFERDPEDTQRVPEGGEVAIDAQPDPQGFQGGAGVVGYGGAEFGFVAAVERHTLVAWRAGLDPAGGPVAADELSDPFGTVGVFASGLGESLSGLEVGKHPGSQIGWEGTHRKFRHERGTPMTTMERTKRKTENQNALAKPDEGIAGEGTQATPDNLDRNPCRAVEACVTVGRLVAGEVEEIASQTVRTCAPALSGSL